MRPLFLADENIPRAAVARWRRLGWNVVSIGEVAAGMADDQVIEAARADGRWLITLDADFGGLAFLRRLAMPPLVLYFRAGSYRPEDPAIWFEQLFEAGELQEGALHV